MFLFEPDGADIDLGEAQVVNLDDDDGEPNGLSVTDGRVEEGGTHIIRVRLQPAATTPVSVSLATTPDSAVNGRDFYGVYRQLRFEIGETEIELPLQTLDDTEVESEETLYHRLFDAEGAEVIVGRSRIIITDND